MMKKIISMILTAICFLSVSVMASAAAMTDEQKNELLQFGIMTGDPSGDLRLDETITRAEAIKMICAAGNLGTEIVETNAFSDVLESHWAYRYIAAAKASGIVNGDEKGLFNPEEDVTNEEIIKMTVCLVGYAPMAEAHGGFPAGYTAAAARIGLTENMQFAINAPATRNDVGIIIDHALTVPIMKKTENPEEPDVEEYMIMDGSADTALVTLKNSLIKYDSSLENISKLANAFASQYPYQEGDTEKSFALYPDIIYSSGMEKAQDGREYECPAIFDDRMAAEEVHAIKTDNANLFIGSTKKAYNAEFAVYRDKLLVPLRVFELAGCSVTFDKTSYTAAISKDSTVLEIIPNLIGMRKGQAEGFWIPLEVCARFVNNTLYVTCAAVARVFDMDILWDQDTGTITLN